MFVALRGIADDRFDLLRLGMQFIDFDDLRKYESKGDATLGLLNEPLRVASESLSSWRRRVCSMS